MTRILLVGGTQSCLALAMRVCAASWTEDRTSKPQDQPLGWMGTEQKINWGWRGSYFVEFCYLRQRDRLAEDVARVLFLELLEGPAQEDEEGSQLHLQGHLLDFNLKEKGRCY